MKLLITGGAGFIGSNFIHYILNKYPHYKVVNLDKLTYAGNLENLRDIRDNPRYKFVRGDICDETVVNELAKEVDAIINFAAETHVDRSISDPQSFIRTDILGTQVLLEATKKYKLKRYLQVSTDEVYGSIEKGSFRESDLLTPSSPYAASKAGGDLMVIAYHKTFGLPVVITRGSNTYGPYQYPEKLIPLFITNLLENKKVPIYGDGLNVRDWLYVRDHCSGIDLVFHKGKGGEIYNLAAGNEKTNLEITKIILSELSFNESWIEYVKDRPGHDRRYSLETTKIRALGWKPEHNFNLAIKETIDWYRENEAWWKPIKSGEFLEWYKKQYERR